MRRSFSLSALTLLLVAGGCSSLPDLARGREAAAAGRVTEAARDLKPLAARGYPLAQTSLARLYAQAGGAEAAEEAQRWYRSALPRVPTADLPLARLLMRSQDPARLLEARELLRQAWQQRQDVEALTGLIDLYSAHPQLAADNEAAALTARAEQLQHAGVQAAVIRWYRSTREAPGHAERLVKLCENALAQVPECYVELARHRRSAGSPEARRQLVQQALAQFEARQVEATTLAGVARALVEDPKAVEAADMPAESGAGSAPDARTRWDARSCGQDPVAAAAEAPAAATPAATADPELAASLLQRLAAGEVAARVAAAAVVVRYPYLVPDFDAEAALKAGVTAQQPEAALHLAHLYIEGLRAPRDPQAALALLQPASERAPTATQAHYLLGRLYQHGYLDEIDPKRALDHLLVAARSGYLPADAALARLFAAGRGMCPDPVAAAVFAALAAEAGDAAMRRLQEQLQARMGKVQARAANALYQQELAARGAAANSAARAADAGAGS